MSETTTTTDAPTQVAESESDSEPLSRAVLEAVADAEGVDQTELEPLFYAIDPDTLDALFRPHRDRPGVPDVDAEIRFSYHGYRVRATASGRVTLEKQ